MEKSSSLAISAALLLAAATYACMNRYRFPADNRSPAFRFDRWTGEMVVMYPAGEDFTDWKAVRVGGWQKKYVLIVHEVPEGVLSRGGFAIPIGPASDYPTPTPIAKP